MVDFNERREFIKVVTLGYSGVGKTSLLKTYNGSINIDNILYTISAEYFTKKINFEDSDYTMQIWDTPGREVFF